MSNSSAPELPIKASVLSMMRNRLPSWSKKGITITTASAITASNVIIGRAVSNYFSGSIDDVRIYNRALSAGEVSTLYHLGTDVVAAPEASKGNTSGLVGYWSFDGSDISGTTVTDLSISGNSGTITSATPALGKLGQALSFNGTSSVVTIADADSLSFGNGATDSPMSVSAWINMNDASEFKILSKGIAFSNQVEYYFRTGNHGTETDNLIFKVYDQSASAAIGRQYSTALTSYEGQWIHVVATYDGSAAASGIRLYVNGIRVDNADSSSGSYVAMENGASNLLVGKYNTYYANGKIDEVRLYNRALSAGEVGSLYNTGQAVIRK